jgi:hypothetical protein
MNPAITTTLHIYTHTYIRIHACNRLQTSTPSAGSYISRGPVRMPRSDSKRSMVRLCVCVCVCLGILWVRSIMPVIRNRTFYDMTVSLWRIVCVCACARVSVMCFCVQKCLDRAAHAPQVCKDYYFVCVCSVCVCVCVCALLFFLRYLCQNINRCSRTHRNSIYPSLSLSLSLSLCLSLRVFMHGWESVFFTFFCAFFDFRIGVLWCNYLRITYIVRQTHTHAHIHWD